MLTLLYIKQNKLLGHKKNNFFFDESTMICLIFLVEVDLLHTIILLLDRTLTRNFIFFQKVK
jgi:hypothetical protein